MIKHNIKDENKFKILGSIAFKEEGLKRMFLKDIESLEEVNARAGRLASNNAGMQVRFTTNSKKININVKLSGKSNMSNMSSLGQSGVDLYIYHKELGKYVFQKSTPYEIHLTEYNYELYSNKDNEMNDFIINLPLYNSATEVILELEKDAIIIPYKQKNNDNIIFYGTSIVQGGTVTRAGLLYSNMISRKIDNEIFNFGFSGVAFLETEMAKIISQVKTPKLLIIDAEPNAGVDEKLINNLDAFIDTYRKYHQNTIILVCSRISYAFDYKDQEVIARHSVNKKFQQDLVKRRSKQDKNIFYVDGDKVFGKDFYEYTVDGIHPNDMGSQKLADFYYKEILKYI